MEYIPRIQEARIAKAIRRDRSVLLLGARQTGKTTLIQRLRSDLSISFVRPDVRQRYERDPGLLAGEVEALGAPRGASRPLVLLDEVQKVPDILDAVQDLIDRRKANFVLTGSSARKLRRGSRVNLLPGRVVAYRLDPLIQREWPASSVKEPILYGSLPGMARAGRPGDRETDLESYVTTYLEEEIRSEAIVRNLGSFARFLEYAASESGGIVNLRKLSQEIGVAHTTISAYHQILEDCLIADRIEPLTESKTRKKLTKAQRYLLFDLGVRRVAAREGTELPRESWGALFEQWVGLELVRCARLSESQVQIRYWRDPDGPEVDWVIARGQRYVPVEVKWTENPSLKDIRHLRIFLSEYKKARVGYLVCRIPRRIQLEKSITAIPWQEIDGLIFGKDI
ncbi:MAG: ATP-binding protein [Candidatus Omnitrophica bacterium]|nr:ATP-binding protein [Candidatus Omnitrophota bacterium]